MSCSPSRFEAATISTERIAHPHRAALQRNAVNRHPAILVGVVRQCLQIVGELLGVEPTVEDPGEPGRGRDRVRAHGPRQFTVHRDRGLVQIALKHEAGLRDELLVFGIAVLPWLFAEIAESPDRLEVGVKNGIAIGQQAGRFRGGMFAQEDGACQHSHDEEHDDRDPDFRSSRLHRV